MKKAILMVLVAAGLVLASCSGGGASGGSSDWKGYVDKFSALTKKLNTMQTATDLNSLSELPKIMEELTKLQKEGEDIAKKLSPEEAMKFTEAMTKLTNEMTGGK